MGRRLKIAVIGSGALASSSANRQIAWFRWDQISRVRNIRDYDAVVIVIPPLGESVAVDEFERVFTFAVVPKLLKSGTRVIFLGDPRREIATTTAATFLDWTGLSFPGTTGRVTQWSLTSTSTHTSF